MPHPPILSKIANHYGLTLRASTAPNLAEFMRYGRKTDDHNTYLLAEGRVVGLNLRTNALEDFPWLTDAGLHHLQALNLSENKLTRLTIPAELHTLVHLDVSDNDTLQELHLPTDLPQLATLDASDSALASLRLPANCPVLAQMDVSRNKLQTLTFAAACPRLTILDLSGNEALEGLDLPAGFVALTHLYLKNTGLQVLEITGALPMLKVLDIGDSHLAKLPADVILYSPLETLYAENNSPKNIPRQFLGTYRGNVLETAKTWFEELRDHPTEENKVVKLMITGNGEVGKSTLLCAMQKHDNRCHCEGPSDHRTTQGIQTGIWEERGVKFNFWDFGGQEVYHSTHRLFFTDEAIQLVVTDEESETLAVKGETKMDREGDDMDVPQPVQYWVQTALELSPNSPLLVVQNKAALGATSNRNIAEYAEEQGGKFLWVDAKTGKDVEDVVDQVVKKAKRLLPQYNMVIPASWVRVRDFFENNLQKAVPEKIISEDFLKNTLCRSEELPVSEASIPLLLDFLHHNGIIYRHEKLEGKVIADQQWALDAIYQPLKRGTDSAEELREDKGMLKVRRLFDLFGNNYEEEEKWILLDFMISCQMCFQLNDGRETSRRAQSDKYIFPKFLPEQPAEEVRFYWKERAKNTLMVWQKLPWINYYLMQSFITQLGRKTTLTNIWRNGIHISTPEGYFLAELDYPNKEFTIWIEASAAPAWLPQILEAFDYREEGQEWKISHDNRQTEALFELEKWQKEQDGPAGKGAMKEAGFENLGEVKTAQNTEIILLLTAVPLTLTKINHNNEYAAIDEVLKARSVRDKFTLVSVNHTTIPKMIEQITTEHPSILHFVGHGEEDNPGLGIESGLMFHPTDGNIQPEKLKAKEAHDLFKRLKEDCPSLKIVFLNACYSEDLAKAISEAGLSVIGTSTEILSPVAVRFATGFYGEYTRQETTNLIKAMRHGITLATATAYQANQEFHLFENGERIALA